MIDWHSIARSYGYSDIWYLFNDLYIKKNLSPMEISKKIGVSVTSIRAKLKILHFEIKERGGAKNKGGYKQKQRITKKCLKKY